MDRFGAVLVVQANAAGIDGEEAILIEALQALLSPTAIVLRNDSPARTLEGLALDIRMAFGDVTSPVEIDENGTVFDADLLAGQKTGWFYDQRDNRAFVAWLASGARVLDLYCYSGGVLGQAARGGGEAPVGLDRSPPAPPPSARSPAEK